MEATQVRSHADYGNYNEYPKGFKYISEDEFKLGFFQYCLMKPDSKQIFRRTSMMKYGGHRADLRLFNLDYDLDTPMGFGIANVHSYGRGSYRPVGASASFVKYFIYGDRAAWKKFSGAFAAQFAGDNS